MDQAEYQRRRRQLDDELRAGIEMLQEGHRAKVEALDSLWLKTDEEAPSGMPDGPSFLGSRFSRRPGAPADGGDYSAGTTAAGQDRGRLPER